MRCQICSSDQVIKIGKYHPYLDYSSDIYDCKVCLSRFTPHDAEAHEKLHEKVSSYSTHQVFERVVKKYIETNDINGLRKYLSKRLANEFIIRSLDENKSINNILEIGCSRGYLTSYFLETDRKALGVDISPTAVEAARQSFGDHFAVVGDPRIEALGPYDAIFHVGTIGCVSNPMEFTKKLLAQLKPGGILIFNAPNRLACDLSERIWVSTAPPDLVTLFHPDIWMKKFSSIADVSLEIGSYSRLTSGYVHMLAAWNKKPTMYLFEKQDAIRQSYIERFCKRALSLGYAFKGPTLPQDYGVHVQLRRRNENE